jgi:peptidoglycan/LPS O-acetylase OafA/YrhL
MTEVAVIAVGGFFVLSGYTIRSFSPSVDEFDARSFFVDRATRLLSVTLLALVATLALDTYSSAVAPGWYNHNWGSNHPVLSMVANVLLLNQVWGFDVSPLSNSPFWSLGYEAGFYAIWGALLYCRHVVAASYRATWHPLERGIQAVFLLIGCSPARVEVPVVSGCLLFTCLLVALFAALALVGPRVRPGARLVAFARKLGDATFPLYLLHFPVLVAIGATRQGQPLSTSGKLIVLVVLLALAFAVVPLAHRLKNTMRALANRRGTVVAVHGVASADDVIR